MTLALKILFSDSFFPIEELGGDALVIATGGFGNTMAQGTDCIDEVDQMLTLEGLRLIFEKNKK